MGTLIRRGKGNAGKALPKSDARHSVRAHTVGVTQGQYDDHSIAECRAHGYCSFQRTGTPGTGRKFPRAGRCCPVPKPRSAAVSLRRAPQCLGGCRTPLPLALWPAGSSPQTAAGHRGYDFLSRNVTANQQLNEGVSSMMGVRAYSALLAARIATRGSDREMKQGTILPKSPASRKPTRELCLVEGGQLCSVIRAACADRL